MEQEGALRQWTAHCSTRIAPGGDVAYSDVAHSATHVGGELSSSLFELLYLHLLDPQSLFEILHLQLCIEIAFLFAGDALQIGIT